MARSVKVKDSQLDYQSIVKLYPDHLVSLAYKKQVFQETHLLHGSACLSGKPVHHIFQLVSVKGLGQKAVHTGFQAFFPVSWQHFGGHGHNGGVPAAASNPLFIVLYHTVKCGSTDLELLCQFLFGFNFPFEVLLIVFLKDFIRFLCLLAFVFPLCFCDGNSFPLSFQ